MSASGLVLMPQVTAREQASEHARVAADVMKLMCSGHQLLNESGLPRIFPQVQWTVIARQNRRDPGWVVCEDAADPTYMLTVRRHGRPMKDANGFPQQPARDPGRDPRAGPVAPVAGCRPEHHPPRAPGHPAGPPRGPGQAAVTALSRRRARAMRAAAMRRLGDLIDELEPGAVDPEVVAAYRTVAALDVALAATPWWSRKVLAYLPEPEPRSSAHKELVAR